MGEPCGYNVPPVDVFSCGVCFFIMVSGGAPPWKQAKLSDQHFRYVQKQGIAAMLKSYQRSLEPQVTELLADMLKANPMQRATFSYCLANGVFSSMLELGPRHV